MNLTIAAVLKELQRAIRIIHLDVNFIKKSKANIANATPLA
jgi:hypothetical protein